MSTNQNPIFFCHIYPPLIFIIKMQINSKAQWSHCIWGPLKIPLKAPRLKDSNYIFGAQKAEASSVGLFLHSSPFGSVYFLKIENKIPIGGHPHTQLHSTSQPFNIIIVAAGCCGFPFSLLTEISKSKIRSHLLVIFTDWNSRERAFNLFSASILKL